MCSLSLNVVGDGCTIFACPQMVFAMTIPCVDCLRVLQEMIMAAPCLACPQVLFRVAFTCKACP